MNGQVEGTKVPKLRFPDFRGAWNSKMLGEICSITTGKLDANAMIADGQYRFYTCAKDYYQIDEFAFDTEALLISGNGANVGYIHYYRGRFNAYQRTYVLDKFSQNIHYVEQFLRENLSQRIGLEKKAGNTPYIVMGTLAEMPLAIPTLPEQQKIADFLGAVDARVGLLQRRREALTAYKKAMMQRLFARTLRFTKPDGSPFPDWQFFAADALFRSVSNKNHHGELTILAATQDGGMVPRDQLDMEIQSSAASVLSYKTVEVGDFVISLRSFQGGIEHSNYHGICSPAYTVLKANLEIACGFYSRLFKTKDFIERLSATVVGIRDGKQISFSAFSTLRLPYPHPEEQQKIADFLTALDTKIDAVAAQIAAMQRFKQCLLQQMFV